MFRRLTDDDKDWFFEFYEDWSQLLGGCNWYAFRFCHIEVEWDKAMGGIEATITFMGLGFRWRWNYTVTELAAEIRDRVARVVSGEDEAVPWEEAFGINDNPTKEG